jgi:hypothetical protein
MECFETGKAALGRRQAHVHPVHICKHQDICDASAPSVWAGSEYGDDISFAGERYNDFNVASAHFFDPRRFEDCGRRLTLVCVLHFRSPDRIYAPAAQ